LYEWLLKVWKVALSPKQVAAVVMKTPKASLLPALRARLFSTEAYKTIPVATNAAQPKRCVQMFAVSICKQSQRRTERL
jgi:hypothetical protein